MERATLDRMLREAVNKPTSFNSMSVDSDESTSDTVVAISSNMVPCPSEDELGDAISKVCAELSDDVVRNGEGTNHVLEVTPPRARTRGSLPLPQTQTCSQTRIRSRPHPRSPSRAGRATWWRASWGVPW